MREVEASGRTVDEAIDKALAELGISREQADIEVLSEGKNGFLGIGGEDARVIVSISGNVATPAQQGSRVPPAMPEVAVPGPAGAAVPAPAPSPAPVAAPRPGGEPVPVASAETMDLAEDVLTEILSRMGMDTRLARYDAPNPMDPDAGLVSVIDIRGSDLGLLIGRRGETLESLQYLVNLVVQRRTGTRQSIEIDVEGYRARRVVALQKLAARMAEQVRRSDRPSALEPMSARDRRIVHLALQEEDGVTTESSGEGENRKVVIYPRGEA